MKLRLRPQDMGLIRELVQAVASWLDQELERRELQHHQEEEP